MRMTYYLPHVGGKSSNTKALLDDDTHISQVFDAHNVSRADWYSITRPMVQRRLTCLEETLGIPLGDSRTSVSQLLKAVRGDRDQGTSWMACQQIDGLVANANTSLLCQWALKSNAYPLNGCIEVKDTLSYCLMARRDGEILTLRKDEFKWYVQLLCFFHYSTWHCLASNTLYVSKHVWRYILSRRISFRIGGHSIFS